MKNRLPALVAAALACALALPAGAAGMKTTHVGGNVHMIEGYGGNIGVSVGDDGIVLVDDQFARVADEVRAAVADVHKGDIHFILNTHFHADHTDGNTVFGGEALIIAHDNVRERLSTKQMMWGETQEPLDPVAWPVITFDRSVKVHFNGEEIRVIHLPSGHTDGDAIVHFTESNVLHMGDLLFSGLFPYVDLEHGGNLSGFAANLERVLAMDLPPDIAVIPGHGPLSTLGEVRASLAMIEGTTSLVSKRIEEGASLAEIQKEGLPAEFDSWNWQFITTDLWIETIWNAAEAEKAGR